MMNRNDSGQAGFTLIEIVMVLILLGILAAVAVPKYFDLKQEAVERAADALVADAQARVNLKFAQGVLDGLSCKDSATAAVAEVETEMKKSLPSNVTHWMVGTAGDSGQQLRLFFRLDGVIKRSDGTQLGGVIVIPECR